MGISFQFHTLTLSSKVNKDNKNILKEVFGINTSQCVFLRVEGRVANQWPDH